MNICIQFQESSYFEKFPDKHDILKTFTKGEDVCLFPIADLKSWTSTRRKDIPQDVKTTVKTLIVRGKIAPCPDYTTEMLIELFPKIVGWNEGAGCMNGISPTVCQCKIVLYHEPLMILREIMYLDCNIAYDKVGRMVGYRWKWLVRDLPDEKWPIDPLKSLVQNLHWDKKQDYYWMRESWLLRLLDTYGTQKVQTYVQVFSGMEFYAKDVK